MRVYFFSFFKACSVLASRILQKKKKNSVASILGIQQDLQKNWLPQMAFAT